MKLPLPRSLFGQLMLSQVALMAAMATMLPLLLTSMLNATADRFVAERLARDARSIASNGLHGSSASPVTGAVYRNPRRGRRFAIFDARGAVVEQGPYALPLAFSDVDHGAEPRFFRSGRYDVISVPRPTAGAPSQWVVVSQDRTVPEEIVDDVVSSFLARFVWILPVSLLASLLIGLAVVRRVTGKFRRSALQADQIGLHRIDTRIRSDDLPSEAAPLVHATNRALDRLEAGYRFQGEFVGNVAHELRTPLALISLRTEGLDPSPERDLIQVGVQRANHVVRQLMELASIDRHYPEIEAIDPCALASDVVGIMAPLVYGADHSIAFVEPATAPPGVEGVNGLLQIAITNLIDNAIRHTPARTTIIVSVDEQGNILVEDDGPGLAVDIVDDIPRYRREGTNRSDSAGLGLSIVGRIMTVCGGTVEIGNRPSGGARCTLRLRRRTPSRRLPKADRP